MLWDALCALLLGSSFTSDVSSFAEGGGGGGVLLTPRGPSGAEIDILTPSDVGALLLLTKFIGAAKQNFM